VTAVLVYNYVIRKDTSRDIQIKVLQDAVAEHVKQCTETPNSTLLAEIRAVNKSLADHAEQDRQVAAEIRADIREINRLLANRS
jgi:hypothetical protein